MGYQSYSKETWKERETRKLYFKEAKTYFCYHHLECTTRATAAAAQKISIYINEKSPNKESSFGGK